MAAVQVADHRVDADDRLAFERENRAEHAVRRRVLRPHVHGQPLAAGVVECRGRRGSAGVSARHVDAVSAIRRIRRVDGVGLQQRMPFPVVGAAGCGADPDVPRSAMPNMSKHSRSIQLAPRYTGTSDGHVVTPGAEPRLSASSDSAASRLSTHATTSRPSSFQSIAVRNEKKRAAERVLREPRDRPPLRRPARARSIGAAPSADVTPRPGRLSDASRARSARHGQSTFGVGSARWPVRRKWEI